MKRLLLLLTAMVLLACGANAEVEKLDSQVPSEGQPLSWEALTDGCSEIASALLIVHDDRTGLEPGAYDELTEDDRIPLFGLTEALRQAEYTPDSQVASDALGQPESSIEVSIRRPGDVNFHEALIEVFPGQRELRITLPVSERSGQGSVVGIYTSESLSDSVQSAYDWILQHKARIDAANNASE